jgi:hypothetical protein
LCGPQVNSNFSNYSAWHYRANFLSLLYNRGAGGGGGEGGGGADGVASFREKLREESEMVSGAVFTDPADQSPWIYLRWIVRQFVPERATLVAALCGGESSAEGERKGDARELVLGCSRHISNLQDVNVVVEGGAGGGRQVDGAWSAVSGGVGAGTGAGGCSKLWRFEPACPGGLALAVGEAVRVCVGEGRVRAWGVLNHNNKYIYISGGGGGEGWGEGEALGALGPGEATHSLMSSI